MHPDSESPNPWQPAVPAVAVKSRLSLTLSLEADWWSYTLWMNSLVRGAFVQAAKKVHLS